MKFDFVLWRLYFCFAIAKTGLWAKADDLYLFHVGTFTNGKNTALKVIILPFSLMVGVIKNGN